MNNANLKDSLVKKNKTKIAKEKILNQSFNSYSKIISSLILKATKDEQYAKSEEFASVINKHISGIKKLGVNEIYMECFLELFDFLLLYFEEADEIAREKLILHANSIKDGVLSKYVLRSNF